MATTYFLLFLVYAIFSYGLTAPNLILINQDWFVQFQTWMWQTFFNNRPLTIKVYLTIIVLLILNYLMLVKKARQAKPNLINYLFIISPLVFTYNALSFDVFNYIFNAKMVLVYQANPHVKTALDFAYDGWLRFMHNVHTPAPYWYGWTALSLLPYLIGFNKFLPTWINFKFFSLISLVLLFFSLKYLLKKLKIQLDWQKMRLLFLNPLLLIEILGNAHNDLWMLIPAILSLGLLLNKDDEKTRWWQPILSILIFGISISTKLATLALSPVLVWLLLRKFSHKLKSVKLVEKVDRIIIENFGTLASGLMFLPLATARSQQFHPWYLTWSLVWLPLIKNKIWTNTLVLFSFSSLLRYLPWLSQNDYNPQVFLQQKLITWILPLSYLAIAACFKLFQRHKKRLDWLTKNWHLWLAALIYLPLHLFQLTKLPVFADEAIYIRWAQLIMDDWQRYLFFPMNDGKTPLFIWLLVPLQYLFKDPLFAGRILSVVTGLAQLIIISKILKTFNLKRWARLVGMFLTAVLPFWFFHHRMALMDSMLTLFISWSWLFLIKTTKSKTNKFENTTLIKNLILTGIMFGLALLVKIPALLFLPIIGFQLIYHQKITSKSFKKTIFKFSLVSLVGISIFASLKLHPAFGQLFNRGNDFLFSLSDLINQNKWQETLANLPSYLDYFITYLTWPVLLLALSGMFFGSKKKIILWTNLSGIGLILPMMLMGKVVYARYLLPIAPFITVSACLSLSEVIKKLLRFNKNLIIVILLIISPALLESANFMYLSYTNLTQLNLVDSDQQQYLKAWSAGYGIKPTYNLIQSLAKKQKVLVGTEGYFGTLPDGLLMYFHQEDVSNIFITGIGQPVRKFPQNFKERAKDYDRVLLVVNSHRLKTSLGSSPLLREYCRPESAPCQQVWDITTLVK